MGRPPCCDKVGVKKGPWTPEEDIMLVSYVQEHGPGNWRAVPSITGLRRCSKSCRLRWTNYLRPGIKRGRFTDNEEKMIIQLQDLLGNKWAAIASYLPERTDNDVKNYWNTHLKKKLKRLQDEEQDQNQSISNRYPSSSHSISRGLWERRLQADIQTAKQALHDALSPETTIPSPESTGKHGAAAYASSAENIARLLKQWESSRNNNNNPAKFGESKCSSTQNSSNNPTTTAMDSSCSDEIPTKSRFDFGGLKSVSASVVACEDITPDPNELCLAPLSMLESWLLDDQGKDYLTSFSFDMTENLF